MQYVRKKIDIKYLETGIKNIHKLKTLSQINKMN